MRKKTYKRELRAAKVDEVHVCAEDISVAMARSLCQLRSNTGATDAEQGREERCWNLEMQGICCGCCSKCRPLRYIPQSCEALSDEWTPRSRSPRNHPRPSSFAVSCLLSLLLFRKLDKAKPTTLIIFFVLSAALISPQAMFLRLYSMHLWWCLWWSVSWLEIFSSHYLFEEVWSNVYHGSVCRYEGDLART
jgi:hypothetical protein